MIAYLILFKCIDWTRPVHVKWAFNIHIICGRLWLAHAICCKIQTRTERTGTFWNFNFQQMMNMDKDMDIVNCPRVLHTQKQFFHWFMYEYQLSFNVSMKNTYILWLLISPFFRCQTRWNIHGVISKSCRSTSNNFFILATNRQHCCTAHLFALDFRPFRISNVMYLDYDYAASRTDWAGVAMRKVKTMVIKRFDDRNKFRCEWSLGKRHPLGGANSFCR